MSIEAECVVRSEDTLGECTVWCDRDQVLWWVDIRAPALKRYDPASNEVHALPLTEAIGSRPAGGGGRPSTTKLRLVRY